MRTRTRIALYGAVAAFVLAAVFCGATVHGRTGQLLTIICGSLGGIGLMSMIFLEVGLSEDREREREAAVRKRSETPVRRTRRPRR